MKIVLSFVFTALLAVSAAADEAGSNSVPDPFALIRNGHDADLSEFVWINRPLVVFADSPADPRYIQQISYITDRLEDLADRDVVVLTDTDPAANGPLRQALRPRGFMLVLIGKDGTKYLRKPFPWHVREITRVIDKLPMRQQELRDRRSGS